MRLEVRHRLAPPLISIRTHVVNSVLLQLHLSSPRRRSCTRLSRGRELWRSRCQCRCPLRTALCPSPRALSVLSVSSPVNLHVAVCGVVGSASVGDRPCGMVEGGAGRQRPGSSDALQRFGVWSLRCAGEPMSEANGRVCVFNSMKRSAVQQRRNRGRMETSGEEQTNNGLS